MNLEEQLAQCLYGYASDGLYVAGGIPPTKLTNAVQYFPIDVRDTVLALIDATLIGSCKKGMAFSMRGVYWKNDWTTKTQRNFMSWEELSSIKHLIGAKSFDVGIGPGNACNLSGSDVKPAQAANLLHQLIDIYNDFKASCRDAHQTPEPPPQPKPYGADIVVSDALQVPAPIATVHRYEQGLPKALAIMICADNELSEVKVELAVQFLEADDGISDKSAAIEALTDLVQELGTDYEKSKPLFKLKLSKLIAQVRAEIVGPPREHVRVMLDELFDQVRAVGNPANQEVHTKLVSALTD